MDVSVTTVQIADSLIPAAMQLQVTLLLFMIQNKSMGSSIELITIYMAIPLRLRDTSQQVPSNLIFSTKNVVGLIFLTILIELNI